MLLAHVPPSSRSIIQLINEHPLPDRSMEVWFLFTNLPTLAKVESERTLSATIQEYTTDYLTPTLHSISRLLLAMRTSSVTPPASTKPSLISKNRGNRLTRPDPSARVLLRSRGQIP